MPMSRNQKNTSDYCETARNQTVYFSKRNRWNRENIATQRALLDSGNPGYVRSTSSTTAPTAVATANSQGALRTTRTGGSGLNGNCLPCVGPRAKSDSRGE